MLTVARYLTATMRKEFFFFLCCARHWQTLDLRLNGGGGVGYRRLLSPEQGFCTHGGVLCVCFVLRRRAGQSSVEFVNVVPGCHRRFVCFKSLSELCKVGETIPRVVFVYTAGSAAPSAATELPFSRICVCLVRERSGRIRDTAWRRIPAAFRSDTALPACAGGVSQGFRASRDGLRSRSHAAARR